MVSWYSIQTGVEVKWMMHSKSCLYHATYDGIHSLCGVSNLKPIDQPVCHPWRLPYLDPSNDGMTCLHCQGLVRRVKNGEYLEMVNKKSSDKIITAKAKRSPNAQHKNNTKREFYHIQCPDGNYREYPYGMKDDAEFDAKLFSTDEKYAHGCNNLEYVEQDPDDPFYSVCPGGKHIVVKGLI